MLTSLGNGYSPQVSRENSVSKGLIQKPKICRVLWHCHGLCSVCRNSYTLFFFFTHWKTWQCPFFNMSEPTTLNTTTTIQYLSQKGYELLDMEAETSLQSTSLQKKACAIARNVLGRNFKNFFKTDNIPTPICTVYLRYIDISKENRINT